jgi:ABC-type nitrate/sulfonate/bicarbonate transport system ATPase subunit
MAENDFARRDVPMGKQPIITLEKVSFSYNGYPVLEDVDLRVEELDFLSIVLRSYWGSSSLPPALSACSGSPR